MVTKPKKIMLEVIKKAKGKAIEEFRAMKTGEKLAFPIDEYNYSTIRAIPSSALVRERCDGWRWKTTLSVPDRAIIVTRVS